MNSKMTEDEIAAQVRATLALAEEVAQVAAPVGLKANVMRGIAATPGTTMRPMWRRSALAAAAAILILAVNAITIKHFVADRKADVAEADPLDQIRIDYSLTDTDI